MKHVLFLTWKDIKHPRAGGAERVMYEYAKRLVNDGNKITWFASSYQGAKNSEQIDGIQVIRKYSLNTIYFFAWKWYKKFKKENTVDIIIDEAGGIPLFSPLYEKQKPIFFFIHHIGDSEWDKTFFFPLNKFFKWAMSKTISLYKNKPTITVSNSTKLELENNFLFSNVSVIHNVCDIEPIASIDFKNKKKEIVFLGRLMPIKRVEDSIQAFFESGLMHDGYKLSIVGEGDQAYKKSLKMLVSKLDIEKSVDFVGYSDTIRRQKLSTGKALLVTSIKEGYGLVVVEANSFGLPVIGYNVSGLRDSIKENINGYISRDNDTKALGLKLRELILDEDGYKKIAKNSLSYVKNIGSWDDKYEEFKKIIIKEGK